MKTNTLITLKMVFFIGFVCQDAIANTPSYKAGKFAVLSEYCGIFEDSNKLFLKYGKGNFQQKEEFNNGYLENDLESAAGGYFQQSLDCSEINKKVKRMISAAFDTDSKGSMKTT